MKPKLTVQSTSALLNDPGITYNEPGVTYNDIRYTYGGVYGQQDNFPSRASVDQDKPQMNTAEV